MPVGRDNHLTTATASGTATTVTATTAHQRHKRDDYDGRGSCECRQSTASVPAGTAGAVTTITIQAKDAQQQPNDFERHRRRSVTGANTATPASPTMGTHLLDDLYAGSRRH